MLRFVFNNKEERAGKQVRTFWIYALGEFALVFLGILIALQVDNWNQNQRVRKLETVMLGELLANLKSDLDDVNSNIDIQTSSLVSAQITLDFIDGDGPWHDSLSTHFGNLSDATIFYENISSYESLKSLGIDLISNDSIRQQITHLYAVSYELMATLEERALTHTFESMNASIGKHLFTKELLRSYVPLDLTELKESNEFRNNVMISFVLTGFQLVTYKRIKEELQNM